MGVSDVVTSKTPGERPEELSKVLLEQILAASKSSGAREAGQEVASQELQGPEADEDCTLTELLAIYKELGRTARADEEVSAFPQNLQRCSKQVLMCCDARTGIGREAGRDAECVSRACA